MKIPAFHQYADTAEMIHQRAEQSCEVAFDDRSMYCISADTSYHRWCNYTRTIVISCHIRTEWLFSPSLFCVRSISKLTLSATAEFTFILLSIIGSAHGPNHPHAILTERRTIGLTVASAIVGQRKIRRLLHVNAISRQSFKSLFYLVLEVVIYFKNSFHDFVMSGCRGS